MKLLVFVAISLTLGFVLARFWTRPPGGRPALSVYSEINIEAPAERVWQIITDPDNYPQWNTFIPALTLTTANLLEGTEFQLDCQITDKQLLRGENTVVLEVDPAQRQLRIGTSTTRGRPGIASNHVQQCLIEADNRTRYINYQEFSGLLGPLVHLLYAGKMQAAFKRANRALKSHAEKMLDLDSTRTDR